MKTCPKCGEDNGNNNRNCYKCGYTFDDDKDVKKMCPVCSAIYLPGTKMCEDCGAKLVPYTDIISNYEPEMFEKWPYVVAVLLPFVGLILGLIFIGQQRREGPSTLGISIVSGIIWAIIGGLIFF